MTTRQCEGKICIALLCVALLCVALHCFALHFALLCFALLCFALLCFALLSFALFYIALHCFALQCFALRQDILGQLRAPKGNFFDLGLAGLPGLAGLKFARGTRPGPVPRGTHPADTAFKLTGILSEVRTPLGKPNWGKIRTTRSHDRRLKNSTLRQRCPSTPLM